MAGYDRRITNGPPAQLVSQDVTNGVPLERRTGKNLVKRKEILSFRDIPSGEFVPDHVADPYAWLINTTSARKRQESTAKSLKAKVAESSYARRHSTRQVLDAGHPYSKDEQEILTSHNSTDYLLQRYGSSTLYKVRGGPLWATGAVVNAADRGRIPFSLSTGTGLSSSYTVGDQIPLVSASGLASVGADAIGRVAPSSDGVNLPYMVAELARDMPRAIGASLFDGDAPIWKVGADEFLNYVFGIAPTVRDLAKLADSLQNLSKRIIQIQRDAGRGVRRKYSYPVKIKDETFTPSQVSNPGQLILAQRSSSYGLVMASDIASRIAGVTSSELHVREEVRDFFNGSFTYYIPAIAGFETKVSEYMASMNKLYHLQPSALAVYNLTPWSWLLDWCYDVSSLLRTAEVTQDDNLVVNYGYVTRLGIRTLRQSTLVSATSGLSAGPSTVHTIRRSFRMVRLRANPYGFVSPLSSEITPMRVAILAALGISRSG